MEQRIDQFHLMKKIGSGYASTVYLATCRTSGNQVAVKLYHKNKLSELNYFQVSREIKIHSSLDHKNIIQLWAAFEDQFGIYLVSEYASKGDVFADVEKRGGMMTEAETVRQVVHPFLLALTYLHELKIMHRDIKPENLLFTATSVLKVADFGLSINFESEQPVTRVGTLDYMAPEVVICPDKHRPSDHKEMTNLYYTPVVDAWAVGVLAYELIIGRPPFDKGHKKLTIAEIINGEAVIPPSVSDGAASFIRWALTKDKHTRPTVQQLIEHPWVSIHMKKPAQRQTAALRLLQRTDSYTDPRMFSPSHAAGDGQTMGPEEMVRSMQVQSVKHAGRMIGQSSSLSAADFLRWRDIAFNANQEDLYGAAAIAGMLALPISVKRKSDGNDEIEGRVPSYAAGGRLLLATGASTRGSPKHSRNNSGVLNIPLGSMSRSMSREELFASLQASAQRLNRSTSFIIMQQKEQQQQQQAGGTSPITVPLQQQPPSESHYQGAPCSSEANPCNSFTAASPTNSGSKGSPFSQASPFRPSAACPTLLHNERELSAGSDFAKLRTSREFSGLPPSSPSIKSCSPSHRDGGWLPTSPGGLKGACSSGLRTRGEGPYLRSQTTPFSPSRLCTSFTTPRTDVATGQVHSQLSQASSGGTRTEVKTEPAQPPQLSQTSCGGTRTELVTRPVQPQVSQTSSDSTRTGVVSGRVQPQVSQASRGTMRNQSPVRLPTPPASPQSPMATASPRSPSLTCPQTATQPPPACILTAPDPMAQSPCGSPVGGMPLEQQMDSLLLDPEKTPSPKAKGGGLFEGLKKVFG